MTKKCIIIGASHAGYEGGCVRDGRKNFAPGNRTSLPSVELAKEADINLDNGILVDESITIKELLKLAIS
jgi:hypothetical protein